MEKLKAKVSNERNLHEHVTDLEILSGLRNLQSETKKQVDKMPVIYDLRKDIRFKEGAEDKARTSTIQLLKNGILPVVTIAEVIGMPLSFVLQIQKELDNKPNVKSRTKQAN